MHRSSNRTIVVFSVLFLVICLLIVHETKAQYGMPSDTLRGVVVEQQTDNLLAVGSNPAPSTIQPGVS